MDLPKLIILFKEFWTVSAKASACNGKGLWVRFSFGIDASFHYSLLPT